LPSRQISSVWLARSPSAAELDLLHGDYQAHLTTYRGDAKAALELLSVGESPRDARLDPIELAACTAVAELVMNLDEAISKE